MEQSTEVLAQIRAINASAEFNRWRGIEVVAAGQGSATIAMPWRPDAGQYSGFLHAGLVGALIDTVNLHRAQHAGGSFGALRMWGTVGYMLAVLLTGALVSRGRIEAVRAVRPIERDREARCYRGNHPPGSRGWSRGLTLRWSGPPPASRLAREALTVIIRLAGQAPSRRRPPQL